MITKEDYVTQSQGIVLRYKGILDFDSFYKESKKWFKDHNYIFNEKKLTLEGQKKRKKYRFGDTVNIQVKNADLERKTIDYVLV